jgi:hypothetical protein
MRTETQTLEAQVIFPPRQQSPPKASPTYSARLFSYTGLVKLSRRQLSPELGPTQRKGC